MWLDGSMLTEDVFSLDALMADNGRLDAGLDAKLDAGSMRGSMQARCRLDAGSMQARCRLDAGSMPRCWGSGSAGRCAVRVV
jgi:hypothetical protein